MGLAALVLVALVAGCAALCNESLACPCNDRVFANGFAAMCEEGACRPATFPGDACSQATPACVVAGGCVDGRCKSLPLGLNCSESYQCGVDGHCREGVCVALPYLGEACTGVCQQDSYCNPATKVCSLLFLQQPGSRCGRDDECIPAARCVKETCVAADAACRYQVRDALLCAARAGCFFGSSNANYSCAMQQGCFYETALLRNCLFEASCGVYLDPGLATLTKVGISVTLVSAGLLAASGIIYAVQRRRAAGYSRL